MKIGLPKRKQIFQPSIFRCYVSFREGKLCWGFCYISDTKTDSLSLVASDNHLSAKVFLFLFFGGVWSGGMNIAVVAKHVICQGLSQYLTNCVFFSHSNFEPWPTLPYEVITIFSPSLYPLPILVFGVKTSRGTLLWCKIFTRGLQD